MKTNKTTLSFTKEELAIIYIALNNYGLEQMNTSKTWGNAENFIENDFKHDVWGQEAQKVIDLDIRVFAAKERLEKKDA